MDYVCGVVEGFYGTPWRCSERKDLFLRLKEFGLNTYMYAPKDDTKHRKLWREQYTDAEKEILKELIRTAESCSIDFVYSVSPGLDIIFSSPADIKHLHEKLKQVYDIGCRCFAILFDDIDPELCLTDKMEFASSADAQVHVTNKLYEWFNHLKLVLFCPTEYCATRAKPDIESSKYLTTLGNKMDSHVHILWTGPKVISETISSKSLAILVNVLKRKPIIWDNIHANDYDQRRIFLGPYKGRPLEIYKNTSGILTNPNCEYECNYIAIHSLSSWLKNAKVVNLSIDETKKEIVKNNESGYDIKQAMLDAVLSWMDFFKLTRDSFQGTQHESQKVAFDANKNSLLTKARKSENEDEGMVNGGASKSSEENNAELGGVKVATEDMLSPNKKAKSSVITIDDVSLLCDLFHLPYEHGEKGQKMITEIKWLIKNAIDFNHPPAQSEIDLWIKHCLEFQDLCHNVEVLFERMQDISNKRLLQQLYPYIYDVKEVVHLLSKFAKWLGSEKRQKGESYFPKDPEAWLYRGGIAAEMESLLPSADEKLSEAEKKVPKVQTIRPYLPQDKGALYNLCRLLTDKPDSFQNHPELPGESLLGPYLESSSAHIYVVEKNDKISGFVAANIDARTFHQQTKDTFLPAIQAKYKQPVSTTHVFTPEEEMINKFYHYEVDTPDEVIDTYKAVLTLRIQSSDEVRQINLTTDRLLKCIFALLQSNVYCELTASMKGTYEELLKAAGFFQIILTTESHGLYYGRTV